VLQKADILTCYRQALTEFPSVLANMDKNLSWTSSLGDAYVNQQQDVMDAVQVMRDRAERAGNLKSTSQEKVKQRGKNDCDRTGRSSSRLCA